MPKGHTQTHGLKGKGYSCVSNLSPGGIRLFWSSVDFPGRKVYSSSRIQDVPVLKPSCVKRGRVGRR